MRPGDDERHPPVEERCIGEWLVAPAEQERARLADEQYVRRSYRRAVDPTVVRYRRLLREGSA